MAILMAGKEVIGGPGVEVEIDESLFYKRKYNQDGILGSGEKKETLVPIITERIAKGYIIISHCWKASNELSECGYIHLMVNHSQHFVDRHFGFIHTQNIENFLGSAKKRFLSTTKTPKKDCPSYIHDVTIEIFSPDGENLGHWGYPLEEDEPNDDDCHLEDSNFIFFGFIVHDLNDRLGKIKERF
ncbi:hypothetical protein RF11_00302 [Thelohanellus kitauei]|uniref:ISXO2-like transposase domain-containing protein n=1 Tax=Thelohanellus kitauei TaxID=669202 RepID=A0A0C2NKM5_THEKT|nr:hypothetical protein RF11_00302 [Thelohanellus kitauei]